tara:strand:- start:2223 stop:2771 length:549 start_codon:yes stop_codon:yes gene_type:complete
MFDIKVTPQIKEYSLSLIEKYNFGRRDKNNGTAEQQLSGIIGQNAILNECNMELIKGDTGFDGGRDMKVGENIVDIKTMTRTVKPRADYVNNFEPLQDKGVYKTNIYIFSSLNKKNDILTVCGWITRNGLRKKGKLYKKGEIRPRGLGEMELTKDNIEIYNYDLNIVLDAEHMLDQIYMEEK